MLENKFTAFYKFQVSYRIYNSPR